MTSTAGGRGRRRAERAHQQPERERSGGESLSHSENGPYIAHESLEESTPIGRGVGCAGPTRRGATPVSRVTEECDVFVAAPPRSSGSWPSAVPTVTYARGASHAFRRLAAVDDRPGGLRGPPPGPARVDRRRAAQSQGANVGDAQRAGPSFRPRTKSRPRPASCNDFETDRRGIRFRCRRQERSGWMKRSTRDCAASGAHLWEEGERNGAPLRTDR